MVMCQRSCGGRQCVVGASGGVDLVRADLGELHATHLSDGAAPGADRCLVKPGRIARMAAAPFSGTSETPHVT